MDDIVPIKPVKIVKPQGPQPVQAASVPGMLGMFQIEWDGLMLLIFALEQQLRTARQELSHALCQHDAACRVIARLKKERDEARVLLSQLRNRYPCQWQHKLLTCSSFKQWKKSITSLKRKHHPLKWVPHDY